MSIWLPDAEDVEAVHQELVAIFAHENDPISPPGVKSKGLIESACHRPSTAIGKIEKYPDLFQKAAVLFHSLTKNHPFHNGNKRTALVTLLMTLYNNDKVFKSEVDDNVVFDLVVSVTANEFPSRDAPLDGDDLIEALARWLKVNSESHEHTVGEMMLSEFIEKCRQAGCKVKEVSGGSWSIQSQNSGSVRISKSTRKISGAVVRQYLKNLHLAQNFSGLTVQEFQTGKNPNRDQIYRFIAALRRLAKT